MKKPHRGGHATKKPRKKGSLEVMGGYKIDLDRGGQLAREHIDVSTPGDYGADPIGSDDHGVFRWRMVPSGDIVDKAEHDRRLARGKRTHATKKSAAQLQAEIDEALRAADRKEHGYDTGPLSERDYAQAARFEEKRHGLTRDEALRYVKHPRYLSIRKDVEVWRSAYGYPATNSSTVRDVLLRMLLR